ncbi:MAG: hypothetical protein MSH40_00015 [Christensenella sp.]|nr:hypothetical protein [Christensenella sp.]
MVNTREMGEVIDMIKDLEESIYYCTIVEAMAGDSNYNYYRDIDQNQGRMYYSGNDLRDTKEGRSPMIRRTYMESKEMHKDKNSQMQELEKYTRELSADVIDMIRGSSMEEKQILQRKLNEIAS